MSEREIIEALRIEVARLRDDQKRTFDYVQEGRSLFRELASAADGAVLAGELFPDDLNRRVGLWLRGDPLIDVHKAYKLPEA
jgi:hypothetical protein